MCSVQCSPEWEWEWGRGGVEAWESHQEHFLLFLALGAAVPRRAQRNENDKTSRVPECGFMRISCFTSSVTSVAVTWRQWSDSIHARHNSSKQLADKVD